MPALYIAIDPGFDSIKVCANGKVFKFPCSVEETDERKMSDYGLREDFIRYRAADGSTYRVGAYAREYVFEHMSQQDMERQMEGFYSESRFTSDAFIVGLRTAIALAIEANGNIHDPEIYLMVALPHAVRQKYAPSIVGAAAGDCRFVLQHGPHPEQEYRFSIHERNVFTVSQTIAAIIGETSDDKGNIDADRFFYLSNGPTLVVDGGYYTTGLVSVSRGGSVDDEKTESDTQHAMRNVNMLVSDAITAYRPDVRHYVLEYMIQNGGKLRYMADGKAQTIDLTAMQEEKIHEVCASLIEYLNEKYNNLLDYNYVMVTGGTGARFYIQLRDYYVGAGVLDQDHFLLANSRLGKESYSIEYSIVIGAYKGLLGKCGA